MPRRTVFTPHAIATIRQMVEAGRSIHAIAHAIGSTEGSVRVKCSHLKIVIRCRVPRLASARSNDSRHITLGRDLFELLKAEGRKRHITAGKLARLLLTNIMVDKMVDAVLDDDALPEAPIPGKLPT